MNTPGTNKRAKPVPTPTVYRSVSQSSGPKRTRTTPSEARQSGDRPSYASVTAPMDAADANMLANQVNKPAPKTPARTAKPAGDRKTADDGSITVFPADDVLATISDSMSCNGSTTTKTMRTNAGR